VIAGCQDREDIEDFGEDRLRWLQYEYMGSMNIRGQVLLFSLVEFLIKAKIKTCPHRSGDVAGEKCWRGSGEWRWGFEQRLVAVFDILDLAANGWF